jgi:hypothetical protein
MIISGTSISHTPRTGPLVGRLDVRKSVGDGSDNKNHCRISQILSELNVLKFSIHRTDFEQPRSMLVPIEIFQDNNRPGMPRGARKAKKGKMKAKKNNRASSPASSTRSRASFATSYDAFCEPHRGFWVA